MDKPHKRLNLWKEAMVLVKDVFRHTGSFPADQRFCLTDQLRRSSISIPSNIAEGAARQTNREFVQFLSVAQASLSELDTQLEIARQLGFLEENSWAALDTQVERIDKMLSGLIKHQRMLRKAGKVT